MHKILMIIPTLNCIGGAQEQLKLLSKELHSLGVPSDIYVLEPNLTYENTKKLKSTQFIKSKLKRIWIFNSLINAFQKARKYEIFHLHGLGWGYYIFGLIAAIYNKRMIVKIPRTGDGSYIQQLKKKNLNENYFSSSVLTLINI